MFNESSADDELAWRETYFILFRSRNRPTLTQVEAAIGEAGKRLAMDHLEADEEGFFQSVLVQAPEDSAAMEISLETGEAVLEQSAEVATSLRKQLTAEQLNDLFRADARLDVMHFERLTAGEFEDEDDPDFEGLNPASLIAVVNALTRLTRGIAIDPAAGEVML